MPSGELLGTVQQVTTCFTLEYRIQDASGATVLVLTGSNGISMGFGKEAQFNIMSGDGSEQIGQIVKTRLTSEFKMNWI